MKRLTVFLLLCGAVCAGAAAAQKGEQVADPCGRRTIPLKLDAGTGLEVMSHRVSFRREVVGEIFFRNRTGKDIKAITLLVNYLDAVNRVLFSIPYQGNIRGAENKLQNVRPFFTVRFPKPIAPGGSFYLKGTNLLSVTVIPDKAAVSLLNLQFRDGGMDYSPPVPWMSDPMIDETPEYFRMPRMSNEFPAEVFLIATIREDGHVAKLVEAQSIKLPDEVLDVVKSQIALWSFFPAIKDGYGNESKLNLLLRFHLRRHLYIREKDCFVGQREKAPSTFVTIDFELAPDSRDRWIVYCAGYPAGGRFVGPIVTVSSR